MKVAALDDLHLHYKDEGDSEGAAIVFANALGTDLRIWDEVVEQLPRGLRVIRYDMRGHGLSDCPPGPYDMETLVTDAERLLVRLEVREAVFVGLSIGGMVAQGLAARRKTLVRALVLSNTAAKIGTPEQWDDRIATVRREGIAGLADGTMERWFSSAFRKTEAVSAWRHMLTRQPVEGYVGCAAAVAGADLTGSTRGLALPTLAIGGADDGSTPPDLVRETAELVDGAEFRLIRRAGHLPCVEQPGEYADILSEFLTDIRHV